MQNNNDICSVSNGNTPRKNPKTKLAVFGCAPGEEIVGEEKSWATGVPTETAELRKEKRDPNRKDKRLKEAERGGKMQFWEMSGGSFLQLRIAPTVAMAAGNNCLDCVCTTAIFPTARPQTCVDDKLWFRHECAIETEGTTYTAGAH